MTLLSCHYENAFYSVIASLSLTPSLRAPEGCEAISLFSLTDAVRDCFGTGTGKRQIPRFAQDSNPRNDRGKALRVIGMTQEMIIASLIELLFYFKYFFILAIASGIAASTLGEHSLLRVSTSSTSMPMIFISFGISSGKRE